MKIEIADQDVIAQFDEIGGQFFETILSMSYGECLVTDESRLSDFAFSGWSDEDSSEDDDLNTLYDKWDAWVIEKIAAQYGLRVEKTGVTLVQLFEQIRLTQQAAAVH